VEKNPKVYPYNRYMDGFTFLKSVYYQANTLKACTFCWSTIQDCYT